MGEKFMISWYYHEFYSVVVSKDTNINKIKSFQRPKQSTNYQQETKSLPVILLTRNSGNERHHLVNYVNNDSDHQLGHYHYN